MCATCVWHRTHSLAPDRRLTKWENTLTRQLITEAVPFAFEKCLADVAVQNWGDNIQSDILSVSACLHAGHQWQHEQPLPLCLDDVAANAVL